MRGGSGAPRVKDMAPIRRQTPMPAAWVFYGLTNPARGTCLRPTTSDLRVEVVYRY